MRYALFMEKSSTHTNSKIGIRHFPILQCFFVVANVFESAYCTAEPYTTVWVYKTGPIRERTRDPNYWLVCDFIQSVFCFFDWFALILRIATTIALILVLFVRKDRNLLFWIESLTWRERSVWACKNWIISGELICHYLTICDLIRVIFWSYWYWLLLILFHHYS